MLVGGQAALLLQIAHPLIATAVAAHGQFQADPLQRLRRTLEATLLVTFGDETQARAAAERVMAAHRGVRGKVQRACGMVAVGDPYDASDPALGMWVHATLVSTALDVFHRFVRPIDPTDRARYYEESKKFAMLFGVPHEAMPGSYRDFTRYFEMVVTDGTLTVCAEARELAGQILHPPLPRLGWAVRLGRVVTAGLLPARIRDRYGLAWGPLERVQFESLRASARPTVALLPDRLRYWPHYLAARERLA